MNSVEAYVFDTETVVIPDEVIAAAKLANDGKRIHDRRTKGSKIIAAWADEWRDENEANHS